MRHLLLVALLGGAVSAQAAGPRASIAVEPLAPDAARDSRIETLIDSLRHVREPWYGVSSTSGGGIAFDAMPLDDIPAAALTALPRGGPPPAWKELVGIGPAAIPALLRHLDDDRATELTFRDDHDGLGGMIQVSELDAGGAEERALVEAAGLWREPDEDMPLEADLAEHTVTVGDCCFAILGQIVDRSYAAVRYQPSALVFVSSPTRDPRIAKFLRAWWGRGDPRQMLAASLVLDLDAHDRRSPGAALRLRVYFATESGAALTRAVRSIPWEEHRNPDNEALLRCALPGGDEAVREAWLELLEPDQPMSAKLAALAAAPSDLDEKARARIRNLRDGVQPPEVVLATLPLLPDEPSEKVFDCLRTTLAEVEMRDATLTSSILHGMARLDAPACLPVFRQHIEKMGRWGLGNVLAVLMSQPRPVLVDALLPPLLDRKDVVGDINPVHVPVPRDTRWCDWAAEILARTHAELFFDPGGSIEQRDRQIAAMRSRLSK